jgi:hypothetical protein
LLFFWKTLPVAEGLDLFDKFEVVALGAEGIPDL